MGKKGSNKKKKKTIVDDVSKNSNGEKNIDAFNKKPKEENKKCKSDTSLKAQNKLSNQTQSIKTFSCKNSLDKPNELDPYVASHNVGANKSSKKCKPPSIKPSSVNNLSQTHKVTPVTLAPFEKKDPISKKVYPVFSKSCFSFDCEQEQLDYSMRKNDSVQPKFGLQQEVPELLVKDFNDKSYLTDFLGGEENIDVAFNIKTKKQKKKCGSDTSSKAQNKLSNQTQSIKTLSCKSSLDKPNELVPYISSHNAAANKSSKKCKSSSIKPSSMNNLSQTHKVKPVTLAPFEKKDPVLKNVYPVFSKSCSSSDSEEEQFDYSIRKKDCVRPKSGIQPVAPELLVLKDYNDKSYLTDFLGDDCYESDEDVACDFFQPVFDKYQNSTNSKNTDLGGNLHGMNVEKSYINDNILSSRASSSTARNFDKYDLEQSENRLEFWSSLPSCSSVRCSKTSDFDDKIELKENISCCVNAYKNSKDTFAEIYQSWLPGRRGTLAKLKALLSEVHNDQLNLNKSQVACKKVGFLARSAKTADNQVLSFLGSFTAFLTDAASGVVSVAQAFNIDAYQSKFKEIMEEDAKITERLYSERSKCVIKYQNIEEVMRKFHPDSFSTAVSKISNSLEINKYWKAMKEAYGKDDMPQLLNIVSKFFESALRPSKLEEVKESVLNYVSDNPRALEACKSATQATYGYVDTWTLNQSRLPALKDISYYANEYLKQEDVREIDRLNNAISEDLPQSKLESQIEDAIDSLESEMKEINHTYYELFKIYVDCNGSEWEISEMY